MWRSRTERFDFVGPTLIISAWVISHQWLYRHREVCRGPRKTPWSESSPCKTSSAAKNGWPQRLLWAPTVCRGAWWELGHCLGDSRLLLIGCVVVNEIRIEIEEGVCELSMSLRDNQLWRATVWLIVKHLEWAVLWHSFWRRTFFRNKRTPRVRLLRGKVGFHERGSCVGFMNLREKLPSACCLV